MCFPCPSSADGDRSAARCRSASPLRLARSSPAPRTGLGLGSQPLSATHNTTAVSGRNFRSTVVSDPSRPAQSPCVQKKHVSPRSCSRHPEGRRKLPERVQEALGLVGAAKEGLLSVSVEVGLEVRRGVSARGGGRGDRRPEGGKKPAHVYHPPLRSFLPATGFAQFHLRGFGFRVGRRCRDGRR